MTVKELRKILKNCKYQDAEIKIDLNDEYDYEITKVSESHIIAEVWITIG